MANNYVADRRVALVTGATGGIGIGICDVLNESDYFVVVSFKNRKEEANNLVNRLKNAVALQMDISDEKSIEAGINKIRESVGRLDVLVNNAGVLSGLTGPLHSLNRSHWEAMLAVHVLGPVITTKTALPLLHESKAGRVINISSVHAISGGRPGLSAYATAKAAIIGFTKAASKELAPNITVNAVAPGFVEVGMAALLSSEQKRSAEKFIPMRRFAKAREVGAAVAFLASEESAYITGHTLIISGGRIELDTGGLS